MAEISAIEWTDSTFNPWIGCTKISPACDHCYAEALMDTRHKRVKWGGTRVLTKTWHQPKRWQRQAKAFFAEHGRRQRVFCASLADVFDNQVPDEWRADLWALIRGTPDLDWQLLTKRPQNIGKMLPVFWDEVKGRVWLGTTVEDQQRADQNIPHLLQHDAAVRFVSIEPMLGPIDLTRVCLVPQVPGSTRAGVHLNSLAGRFWESGMPYCDRWNDDGTSAPGACVARIDWVIAGGESGHHARPSHPDWFRSLRDQCAAAGVPFLFKQWGAWAPLSRSCPVQPGQPAMAAWPDGAVAKGSAVAADAGFGAAMFKGDKVIIGRLLDGVEHNGFPEVQP